MKLTNDPVKNMQMLVERVRDIPPYKIANAELRADVNIFTAWFNDAHKGFAHVTYKITDGAKFSTQIIHLSIYNDEDFGYPGEFCSLMSFNGYYFYDNLENLEDDITCKVEAKLLASKETVA